MVKNLTAMKETWVQSLGWEDSLENRMATQSSILMWRIPWTEEPGGLQSMESQSRTGLMQFSTCTCTPEQVQGDATSALQSCVTKRRRQVMIGAEDMRNRMRGQGLAARFCLPSKMH